MQVRLVAAAGDGVVDEGARVQDAGVDLGDTETGCKLGLDGWGGSLAAIRAFHGARMSMASVTLPPGRPMPGRNVTARFMKPSVSSSTS